MSGFHEVRFADNITYGATGGPRSRRPGHGEIRLRRGTLGEVRITSQGFFVAELRPHPTMPVVIAFAT